MGKFCSKLCGNKKKEEDEEDNTVNIALVAHCLDETNTEILTNGGGTLDVSSDKPSEMNFLRGDFMARKLKKENEYEQNDRKTNKKNGKRDTSSTDTFLSSDSDMESLCSNFCGDEKEEEDEEDNTVKKEVYPIQIITNINDGENMIAAEKKRDEQNDRKTYTKNGKHDISSSDTSLSSESDMESLCSNFCGDEKEEEDEEDNTVKKEVYPIQIITNINDGENMIAAEKKRDEQYDRKTYTKNGKHDISSSDTSLSSESDMESLCSNFCGDEKEEEDEEDNTVKKEKRDEQNDRKTYTKNGKHDISSSDTSLSSESDMESLCSNFCGDEKEEEDEEDNTVKKEVYSIQNITNINDGENMIAAEKKRDEQNDRKTYTKNGKHDISSSDTSLSSESDMESLCGNFCGDEKEEEDEEDNTVKKEVYPIQNITNINDGENMIAAEKTKDEKKGMKTKKKNRKRDTSSSDTSKSSDSDMESLRSNFCGDEKEEEDEEDNTVKKEVYSIQNITNNNDGEHMIGVEKTKDEKKGMKTKKKNRRRDTSSSDTSKSSDSDYNDNRRKRKKRKILSNVTINIINIHVADVSCQSDAEFVKKISPQQPRGDISGYCIDLDPIKLTEGAVADVSCQSFAEFVKKISPQQPRGDSDISGYSIDLDPIKSTEGAVADVSCQSFAEFVKEIFPQQPRGDSDISGYSIDLDPIKSTEGARTRMVIDKWLGSVGIVTCPRGKFTCFRVGSKYVMTALHCIIMLLEPEVVTVHNAHLEWQDSLHKLTERRTSVDFQYLTDHGNRQSNKFFFKGVNKDSIPFFDESSDCIILELEEVLGRPFPSPFRNFGVPIYDKIALIHHSGGQPKKVEHVSKILDMDALQTSADSLKLSELSKQFLIANGKDVSRFQSEVPPYNILKNRYRILLHCQFNEGSPGSPGLQVQSDKTVVVVTMLLHGYPDWHYAAECVDIKDNWDKSHTIEQGADMSHVCEEIRCKNFPLFNDMFVPDARR